ncbi:MAG: hypothetical protein COU90_01950 [Candidatus Ryanbacteria bacterium CG10_big_fil_rev_8_21_14_0_10_43_42]|uniref:Glycosyl transferase family 1 domain-containing protein n=1 Tax=Candidatus Ryanbacteria bacterium CG10_big_fil_rev_8_21_14_0_10_43_42 TaxID=1974864 RepID=A0A2M8KXC5_9BACT|nr:MAG: hypothetical protein COU90_01950 [Candidatus Ryanbacteria bacterium CG10_big_fil_rev_8_21_14_0_10_43_42]
MHISIVGFFEEDHATNWRFLKGLEERDITYAFCHIPSSMTRASWKETHRFLKAEKKKTDVIWIGAFSHRLIPFIYVLRFLVWGFVPPPIVYDSIISIYDTRVFDRGWVGRFSWRAVYYYILDWFACRVAKRLVVDTNEHARYFQKTFFVRPKKLKRLFPGANRDIFYPRKITQEERDERFTVSFHGKLIPGMLGTEYIIEAARILKNEPILIKIFGKGSLYEEYEEIIKKENLTNLKLCGYLEYKDVPHEVSKSDVLLGAFGTTPKALKVIPLKLFEGIALAKAQIIGDTPAARELFKDNVHVVYAHLADGKNLAEKILFMKNNPALRESIAKNGYALYEGVLSDKEVGEKLNNIFKELL